MQCTKLMLSVFLPNKIYESDKKKKNIKKKTRMILGLKLMWTKDLHLAGIH